MATIDSNTGLPALPEGHIWSIEKFSDKPRYADYVYLKLIRLEPRPSILWKKREPKRVEVESAAVQQHSTFGPTIEDAILHQAARLYEEFVAPATERFAYLYGDYPPKTIVADLQEG
jgi:hypothetical protein